MTRYNIFCAITEKTYEVYNNDGTKAKEKLCKELNVPIRSVAIIGTNEP